MLQSLCISVLAYWYSDDHIFNLSKDSLAPSVKIFTFCFTYYPSFALLFPLLPQLFQHILLLLDYSRELRELYIFQRGGDIGRLNISNPESEILQKAKLCRIFHTLSHVRRCSQNTALQKCLPAVCIKCIWNIYEFVFRLGSHSQHI